MASEDYVVWRDENLSRRAELMKFRVRITRIAMKDVEVYAQDIYRAQKIGRSLAEKHDWTDIDTLSYSSLAEPWHPEDKRRQT